MVRSADFVRVVTFRCTNDMLTLLLVGLRELGQVSVIITLPACDTKRFEEREGHTQKEKSKIGMSLSVIFQSHFIASPLLPYEGRKEAGGGVKTEKANSHLVIEYLTLTRFSRFNQMII